MHEYKSQVNPIFKDMGCYLSIHHSLSLSVRQAVICIALVSENLIVDCCIGSLDSFYWPPFYRFYHWLGFAKKEMNKIIRGNNLWF